MHLTPLQKDLYKFTSPSALRPALNAVLFNGWRAVATDSFRLVEVKQTQTTGAGIPEILLSRDGLKAVKTTKKTSTIEITPIADSYHHELKPDTSPAPIAVRAYPDADEYPKYETIKDDCEAHTYTTVVLNGEMLAEIAEYLARFQTNGFIKLRVPTTPNHPIILEARSKTESAYAILMPINEAHKNNY